LDHNGLYHLISMLGTIFLYRGGKRLAVSTHVVEPAGSDTGPVEDVAGLYDA
jgi:hypothetical protein